MGTGGAGDAGYPYAGWCCGGAVVGLCDGCRPPSRYMLLLSSLSNLDLADLFVNG